MIVIRTAADRGISRLDWLESRHTFSFGDYYDPRFMGFSVLRVINDDRVAATMGFDTHGHRNMEIISLVLDGQIAHRDSKGNERTLPAGEFQLMSAGRGIRHSEFNSSFKNPLNFLQIWIQPNVINTESGYQQAGFPRTTAVQAVITPDGRDGTLSIRQDATINHVRMENDMVTHQLDRERSYYLHMIRGPMEIRVAEDSVLTLNAGDGMAISDEVELVLSGDGAEGLLFDMPGVR